MDGVAIHWTVTPARDDHGQCERDWVGVIAQHGAAGYNPPPAYNYGVCPHGVRFEGRTWARRSAANGTTAANANYWAIVALNAPGDVPTPALLNGLAALIDEAPDTEGRTVRPHSDFYATQCCGDELRAWIAAGARAPGGGGGGGGTPPEEDERMKPILCQNNDGIFVYDPNNHTKTNMGSMEAVAAMQSLRALEGENPESIQNSTTDALLKTAVEIK